MDQAPCSLGNGWFLGALAILGFCNIDGLADGAGFIGGPVAAAAIVPLKLEGQMELELLDAAAGLPSLAIAQAMPELDQSLKVHQIMRIM